MTSMMTQSSPFKSLQKLWTFPQEIVIEEHKIGACVVDATQITDAAQWLTAESTAEPLDERQALLRAQVQQMVERQQLIEAENEAHKRW